MGNPTGDGETRPISFESFLVSIFQPTSVEFKGICISVQQSTCKRKKIQAVANFNI
jgi:hypothetical protein